MCLVAACPSAAQEVGASLTLDRAVALAMTNYPAIKESQARAAAAAEGIGVARTAYLPRLDMLWQSNRATRDNVFGLLLPQSVVPSISGPALPTKSFDSVWGSAAGVLLSWEIFDFGQRRGQVDVARAEADAARAQTEATRLDVASLAAGAFLAQLASDASLRAAQANVDRLQVFAEAVRTLVDNQLRPGADASRADAELAVARTELAQVQQNSTIARATLAAALGVAGTAVSIDSGELQQLPLPPPQSSLDVASHPLARADLAGVEAVRARERAVEQSYRPHVLFQSALAGRGTGAVVPGQLWEGSGLWMQVPNWAAGVSVTFPALDLFSVRARSRVELQNELALRARYDQTVQNLTTQVALAQALMTAATSIAQNTPIELQAATEAESRARARYDAGLASITEVADTQRLLAQA